MTTAQAWLYHGNWVADCPREHCASVELLDDGITQRVFFRCSNCGMDAGIEWPPNKQDIWMAVQKRPVPQTRNWFPKNHSLAIRAGLPHGQSLAELDQESVAHGVDCS